MIWFGLALLALIALAGVCGILAVYNLAKARHWDMHR